MSCNESEKAMKRGRALSRNAIIMFIMVLHNSLFVSPEPCQEWQTVGGLCDAFVGQAGQEHCGISCHCTSQ